MLLAMVVRSGRSDDREAKIIAVILQLLAPRAVRGSNLGPQIQQTADSVQLGWVAIGNVDPQQIVPGHLSHGHFVDWNPAVATVRVIEKGLDVQRAAYLRRSSRSGHASATGYRNQLIERSTSSSPL